MKSGEKEVSGVTNPFYSIRVKVRYVCHPAFFDFSILGLRNGAAWHVRRRLGRILRFDKGLVPPNEVIVTKRVMRLGSARLAKYVNLALPDSLLASIQWR